MRSISSASLEEALSCAIFSTARWLAPMSSSVFISPRSDGATLSRTVEQKPLECVRPISGSVVGAGACAVSTKSAPSAAANFIRRTPRTLHRVVFALARARARNDVGVLVGELTERVRHDPHRDVVDRRIQEDGRDACRVLHGAGFHQTVRGRVLDVADRRILLRADALAVDALARRLVAGDEVDVRAD